MLANLGKWLVGILLGWLVEYVRGLIEEYRRRKEKEKARTEDNAQAEVKLEEAQSEQEIIDAGSNHLRR